MMEIATSRPRKTLLTTLALVALAAGPARAQTPAPPTEEKAPAPPPDMQQATPPAVPAPSPMPSPEPPPPVPPAASRRERRPDPEGLLQPSEIPTQPTVETSWFTRTPLKVSFGTGTEKWAFTVFGTIQTDYITDTTRSYNDYIGQQVVARTDTLEGKEGRTQFGMRNTRIGFLLDSPAIGNSVPSAVFQMDFAGNQPSVPFVPPGSPGSAGISESAYYNSPTARVRHAYLTLRNPVVDILAGQTFDVFGWQNYYAPCALLGLPNQTSSRTAQFRVSRSFGAGGPVVVDVALEAARPGQRDAQIPDIEGGVRLSLPAGRALRRRATR